MANVSIVHHYIRGSDDVSFFSWERTGCGAVSVRSKCSEVKGLLRVAPMTYTPNLRIQGRRMFSQVAVRLHFDKSGADDLQALYVNRLEGLVGRVSLTDNAEQTPLKLFVDSNNVTRLRPSMDGRYLAVATGSGTFELWHLDEGHLKTKHLEWHGPSRFMDFAFANRAGIVEVCFSRSNLDLFLSNEAGQIYWWDLRTNNKLTCLSDEDVNWPCYSIDCQPDGDGIAFAGEEPIVWFLNLPNGFWHESVMKDLNPFAMTEVSSFTGKRFWVPQGMPSASVSTLVTGVGSHVRKVQFLTDSRVAVIGPVATEVWDLQPRVKLVKRKEHDPKLGILDICGKSDRVHVALMEE